MFLKFSTFKLKTAFRIPPKSAILPACPNIDRQNTDQSSADQSSWVLFAGLLLIVTGIVTLHCRLKAEWLVPSVQKSLHHDHSKEMCWYQLNMWSLFACSWCPSQTKLDNKTMAPTNPAFTLNHFLSWYRSYQFDSSRIKNRCKCDLKCPWSNQAFVLCETLHCEGSSWTWKKLETVSILLLLHHL